MKGKKKGKKKDEAKPAVQENEDEENEMEFRLVLLEIRVKELETLNLGLKKKCDYLESQNNVYKDQLRETREEKNELVTHLQRNFEEEKTNVKELEDRLFGVQQARADEAKEFEQRLSKKDEEFNEMKFRLDKHILELTAKLTSLEEFRVQKDKLTAEREELHSNLVNERKIFESKFEELENRMIRSRERMKNDAVEMIMKMSKDILKAGRLCLTATVKHAIDENIELKRVLEETSSENLKLREDLQNLSDKVRTKRMTIEVLEEENAMVHTKCLQYKKLIAETAERQMVMNARILSVEELERELEKVEKAHSMCKGQWGERGSGSGAKFRQTVLKASDAFKKIGDRRVGPLESLQMQVNTLENVIIKMAITAKDMTEAKNSEELSHLKGRFWTMLVKLYETACDLPNLPQEVRKKLVISVPKATPYIKL